MAQYAKRAGRTLIGLGVLAAGMLLALTLSQASTRGRPSNLDLSLERVTDRGVFRVELKSALDPIQSFKVHSWSLHVSDAAGTPVTGASIKVGGGMPEHGHGLPTAPRSAPGSTAGDYVINGMKFSMTAWWVLKLEIKAADGRTDDITFNIVL